MAKSGLLHISTWLRPSVAGPSPPQISEETRDRNTTAEICHAKQPVHTLTDGSVFMLNLTALWCQQKLLFIHACPTSGIITEDLVRHFLPNRKTAAVPHPLLPSSPSSPPSLIMPNDTRPHHRKIHSHRSLSPATVTTIILEEETLAINYMCAFHLLFCGGEPFEDLGGDSSGRRWG